MSFPVDAAVSMPIACPELLNSGPPESPGRIGAFVSIIPLRLSLPPWSSPTVIERLTAVTVPEAEVNRPVPPAFPIACTESPVSTDEESPREIVLRFAASLGLQDGDII